MALENAYTTPRSGVHPVEVGQVWPPVGDVPGLVAPNRPSPVTGDLDRAHGLVRERYDGAALQIHPRDVSPVAVARCRLFLLGLNPLVGPVPDVHVRQRQVVLRPVFQLVVLLLGGREQHGGVFVPDEAALFAQHPAFDEATIARRVDVDPDW